MSATIVYAPQFKDRLLEKLPYGKDGALTATQIREQLFPDHISSDIRIALQVLRKFRAVDCQWTKRLDGMGREMYWWRVAE
jgi:hypothetical protein